MIISGFINNRNLRFFERNFSPTCSSSYVGSFKTHDRMLTLFIIMYNAELRVIRLFQFTGNQSTYYYIGHNYYT